MKLLFTLSLSFLSIGLVAQDFVRIEPTTYDGFNQQDVKAFKVEVDRVDRKSFMDHWEKYLDDASDLDIMRSDNLITIEKAILKSIGKDPLNIYMFFEDIEGGTRVIMGFQDTIQGFIGMDNSKYGFSLTGLIKRETTNVFLEAKKGDMKAEEKRLADLEGNLKDIKKDQDKIHKEIISKQGDIEEMKSEIQINKSVVDDLYDEIATLRSDISSMPSTTSKEVKEAKEKELKKSEKKRDKLSKAIEKDSRKIYDYESDIRDLEYELQKLEQDEKFAAEKVMEQRELINALREEIFNSDH